MSDEVLPMLQRRVLSQLVIDDEAAMAAVPLYLPLKNRVLSDQCPFLVLPSTEHPRWDRSLFLNLTFWGGGADVLPDDHVTADVVTHVAWHHLASRAFASPTGALTTDALFLGEAIASAFDVYLVGTLLNRKARAKRSLFLDTQVPAMAETAAAAGLSDREFEVLLAGVAASPSHAFEDLRALLYDVSRALFACVDVDAGLAVIDGCRDHRFAPLLHRFELSGWVLWARAWAGDRTAKDERVAVVDAALRAAPDSLAWLQSAWLT